MDFREREEKFREADRRYAELKRQLDAESISDEEFEAERQRLMVLNEGHWWAKSRETGDWHYHDGSAWIRGTPPGYQPLPTDETSDHRSRHEQTESFFSGSQVREERSPLPQPERNEQTPSQTTSPGNMPTRDQNSGMAQTRAAPVLPPPAVRGAYYVRRRRSWVPILLLLLLLLALLGGTTYALTRATNEVPVPPNAGENFEQAEPGAPPLPADNQQAPPADNQQVPPEALPQQQQQQEEAEPGASPPPADKQQQEQQPQQQQPPFEKGEDDKSKVDS